MQTQTSLSARRCGTAAMLLLLAACLSLLVMCGKQPEKAINKVNSENSNKQSIVLGAGCFWCIDAALSQIEGVEAVSAGYMGGDEPNPSYELVCTKTTKHVEVVKVDFDAARLPLEQLLEYFWQLHDPTQADGQGNDIGPQYRSVIFYADQQQKAVAEASAKAQAEKIGKPLATGIEPAATFWPAEDYHQDYYFNNKSNPYCNIVIQPKLKKLGLEH